VRVNPQPRTYTRLMGTSVMGTSGNTVAPVTVSLDGSLDEFRSGKIYPHNIQFARSRYSIEFSGDRSSLGSVIGAVMGA
jgi:hypothetical protein